MAVGSAGAVGCLPFTLPLLLLSPAWQHGGSAALLLRRLAAALQEVPALEVVDGKLLLRRCLLAARHWLPADMWPLLAAQL